MHRMDERPKISFDKDYKIRVLDTAKFSHAEELVTECGGFVESKCSDKVHNSLLAYFKLTILDTYIYRDIYI